MAMWILVPAIGYTLLIALLFAGVSRFRVPVEPCLILLGSAGLVAFVRHGMAWRTGRLMIASGWVALNVAGIVWSPQVKVAARTLLERVGLW